MTQLKDKFYLPKNESLIGLNLMYDTDKRDVYLDGSLPPGEYQSANDVIGEYDTKAINYSYTEGSKYLYLNIKREGALTVGQILYIIDRVIISENLVIDTTTELELKWK